MKKKRILYFYLIGGMAGGSDTCLSSLIKHLDQMKYKPFVFYKETSQLVEELKDMGIKLVPLSKEINFRHKIRKEENKKKQFKQKIQKSRPGKLRLFLGSMKKTIKQIPEIIEYIKAIKKYKIDIIHTNHYLSGDDRAMILASILMRKKIISHNRGLDKPDLIDKYISKFINKIICVSNFSKKIYTDYGIAKEKCITIYDGVDLNKIKIKNNYSDSLIIGCVGRLEKWKGQHILIEAIPRIKKIFPYIQVHFLGDGIEKNNLVKLVNTLNLDKNVKFFGSVTEINSYVEKFTIAVHTSIEPEPFGMVIIEAMAMQKTVIATNIGGPKEIIADSINGILVEPNKPELLASSIISILKDKKLRQKIELEARRTIEEKFNYKLTAKNIESIYDTIQII